MTRARPCALLLLTLACTLGGRTAAQQPDWPRLAAATQQFGVYGWLHGGALEPDAERAERLRLCGSFVTPASSTTDVLPGCLLFSRETATEPGRVLAEWRELAQLAVSGAPMTNRVGGTIRGIVGFGAVGIRPRVRTTLDAGLAPDVYVPGEQPALVSYTLAPREMGLTQKPAHTRNFARVDRVTLEQRPDGARLRVDGVFTLQGERSSPEGYAVYGEPQRGYLYLSGRLDETEAWNSLAGSNQIARFFVFAGAGGVRVRPAVEPPASPDRLVDWGRVEPRAVTATDYGPVRHLQTIR